MNRAARNALTRRASLLAQGTAGLTEALERTVTTSAKKNHGRKPGTDGEVNKLWKKQIGTRVVRP